MSKHLVFVYGTLKGMKHRFGPGSDLQESKYLGQGVTEPVFNVVDGPYPIAVLEREKEFKEALRGGILGEVYEVTDKAVDALDRYEGYPDLYQRLDVDVNMLDGGVHKAWIYIGNQALRSIGRGWNEYISPDVTGSLYWPYEYEHPVQAVKINTNVKDGW